MTIIRNLAVGTAMAAALLGLPYAAHAASVTLDVPFEGGSSADVNPGASSSTPPAEMARWSLGESPGGTPAAREGTGATDGAEPESGHVALGEDTERESEAPAVSAVPLPPAWWLLASAVALFAFRRRGRAFA